MHIDDLQPKSIGSILRCAIRIYRQHFWTLFGIGLLPYLLLLIAEVACGSWIWVPASRIILVRFTFTPGLIVGAVLFGLVAVWTAQVSVGGVACLVAGQLVGRTPGLVTSYIPVLRRIIWLGLTDLLMLLVMCGVMSFGIVLPLVGVNLSTRGSSRPWGAGVFAILGTGVLVALLINYVILIRFLPATHVIVLEGVWGRAALGRSWALARHTFWRATVVVICGVLGVVCLAWVLRIPARSMALTSTSIVVGTLAWIVPHLGYLVVLPAVAIALTLLYVDGRVRHEGLDVGVLARNLGEPAPPPGG